MRQIRRTSSQKYPAQTTYGTAIFPASLSFCAGSRSQAKRDHFATPDQLCDAGSAAMNLRHTAPAEHESCGPEVSRTAAFFKNRTWGTLLCRGIVCSVFCPADSGKSSRSFCLTAGSLRPGKAGRSDGSDGFFRERQGYLFLPAFLARFRLLRRASRYVRRTESRANFLSSAAMTCHGA